MKLADAVAAYVLHKHSSGLAFERGAGYLLEFSKNVGQIELEVIETLQVETFLDRSPSNITWRLKFQILSRFFSFWSDRQLMPELKMPTSRPRTRQTFVPYILSRAELRSIFRAARQNDNCRSQINYQTMRALILTLYATGAAVSEVIHLRSSDVNLQSRSIRFGLAHTSTREIPLGKDLEAVLRRFISWKTRKGYESSSLFTMKDGQSVKSATARRQFERICRIAGVANSAKRVRLLDLKYAFAVHRITSWIRNKADLNRMMPALAAYMGQSGLGSTARYLSLTPERFRNNLNKLSPLKKRGHWRNDPQLMFFLSQL